jgi:hypothetical protein
LTATRYSGFARGLSWTPIHTQPAKGKKPRKAAAGQKEMLLPISGKRAAKEDKKKVDKPTPARTRKRA